MISASEDLANLADFGEPVAINGQTVHAIFSKYTELIIGGEVAWVGKSLIGTASIFGGLRHGATLQVAGHYYKVEREPFTSPDAALVRVPLIGPIPNPAVIVLTPWTTEQGQPLTTELGQEITLLRLV